MSTSSEQPETLSVQQRPPLWARLLPSAIVVAVAVIVSLALSFVAVPFVIFGPGPTFDVLGKQGDTAILQVEGAQSGAADTGQLRMVTISERGGPGSSVTAVDLLQAWFKAGFSVHKYSEIYPEDVTAEQAQKASSAQMQSSHSTATVAALEHLGYTLPTVFTVGGASAGMGAAGVIEEGDTLVSITTPDGVVHPMNTPSAPFTLMATVPVKTAVKVTVKRDGAELTKTVISSPDPQDPHSSGSKLGIALSLDIDVPVDIAFNLEKVGGPSAGMIFALGIIDKLTDGDLTGGKVIAGTGAMGYDGQVQPIGGIEQKMYGAKRDGADFFLAPRDNCDDVVGNVPAGLKVFAVGTLDQAVDAVKGIASGKTDSLTSCESVVTEQGQSA